MNKLFFIVYVVLTMLLVYSCKKEENKTKNDLQVKQRTEANDTAKTEISLSEKDKIHTIKATFLNYNDDGDFYLLNTYNNEQLINDYIDDRSFLRGDIIEIKWKYDTIILADESKELAKVIVASKKIKDGKLALFKKQYNKPLKYWFAETQDYSEYYRHKIYGLVEYYLANSEKELVKQNIKQNQNLVYSMEEQDRGGKRYTMLGISADLEDHSSIIQWLFYSPENDKLYEYDLPNDKLVEFK